ncbi:MAG: class I SAM-dependent methyltransferase [Planctomycetota bacterium]|nr:class I SAM-dependent methyltransferase [Planctomycetota bacterium]
MNQEERSELAASDAAGSPSKGLAEMQQDLLADLYDDQLLTDCYQKLLDGQVAAGLQELLAGLDERRSNSSDLEWQRFVQLCLLHPVRELLHQDPFTLRAYQKARDDASDAMLLDFVHEADGLHPLEGTSDLGVRIFENIIRMPVCEGFRARARLVAKTVDQLALQLSRPSILTVGAGHLWEASLTGALKQQRIGRWVAFDHDSDSLQEVQQRFGAMGVDTVAGSVRQLLEEPSHLGEFDFIYSTGLFDDLEQPAGKRLTERMFDMLRPGGQILIANFRPEIEGRGYMESFMHWQLIYRTHPDLLDLAMAIDQTRVMEIRLLTEDMHHVLFLCVTKK